MNTIKDLAITYWNNLNYFKQCELIEKYCEGVLSNGEQIENIFYNEVIVKWFQSHGLYELCKTMVKDQIIAAYLEEHTKEQPQSVDNIIDLKKLETQLNAALESETSESLTNWLQEKRKGNTIDVEEKNKSDKEIIDIAFGKVEAIEDNVWDEAEIGYHKLYSVKSVSGLDILSIPQRHLFKWLKQNYSLIKK